MLNLKHIFLVASIISIASGAHAKFQCKVESQHTFNFNKLVEKTVSKNQFTFEIDEFGLHRQVGTMLNMWEWQYIDDEYGKRPRGDDGYGIWVFVADDEMVQLIGKHMTITNHRNTDGLEITSLICDRSTLTSEAGQKYITYY